MKHDNQKHSHERMEHGNPYKKFLLIMVLSFIVMYGIMFLNVDDVDHIYLSVTRAYMALIMVAGMALIMLPMMRGMYPNKKLNRIILVSGFAVFIITLIFLRNQAFIGDRQYMKGMIPHHSSAIMTSRHAMIRNPEVKKLSEQIIRSQEEEIAQMKAKLQELEK